MTRAPLPVSERLRAFLFGGLFGAVAGLFWREVGQGVLALIHAVRAAL